MNKFVTDILIVGGGPAGISAALAIAEHSDSSVMVIDDNPFLGGQIWRSEMGRTKSPETRKVIDIVDQGRIKMICSAQVFAVPKSKRIIAATPAGTIEIGFGKVILATGARERFLPFPSWTLPNVFGAGGLQALVKSGFGVENKRVVVAGTGPLLLAVADFLRSKGARIPLIAEQTPRINLFRFGTALWRQPRKLKEAAALRARLFKSNYLTDCFVTSAFGEKKLKAVNLTRKGKNWTINCDYLAIGFHLVPNTEVAELFGCRLDAGFVAVDKFQETSVKDVYCAGEPTGIGGVELSRIEGEIAGYAAVGNLEGAEKLFPERSRLKRFARSLNEAFELRSELKNIVSAETIVCRCEDVRFGRLAPFASWREAKLQTRCGMGACQGRICGSAAEFLFDWKKTSIRPPIFPVSLKNLADIE